jgi:hypothetical protein
MLALSEYGNKTETVVACVVKFVEFFKSTALYICIAEHKRAL